MKKTIIIPILVLMAFAGLAAAGTLSVRLNNYDATTYTATLEIQNWGAGDLYDIQLSVDGSGFSSVLPGLRADRGKEVIQTIPPGIHNLTLKSNDGQTASKIITLQKSAAQLDAERNAEKEALANQTTEEYEAKLAEEAKQKEAAIQAQLDERQKLIEKLKNKSFEQQYFSGSSTTSTTTTTLKPRAPEAGIVWLLVAVAVLSLAGLVYSIIRKKKK